MRLKRTAAHPYHGRRGGRDLYVPGGGEIELPEVVAASLLRDFPRDWETMGGREREESGSVSPGAAAANTHDDDKRRPPASPMAHEQAPAPAPVLQEMTAVSEVARELAPADFTPHAFKGRGDRDCELCGMPDRNEIHKVSAPDPPKRGGRPRKGRS